MREMRQSHKAESRLDQIRRMIPVAAEKAASAAYASAFGSPLTLKAHIVRKAEPAPDLATFAGSFEDRIAAEMRAKRAARIAPEGKAKSLTLKALPVHGPGNTLYFIAGFAENVDDDGDQLGVEPLISMAHDFVCSGSRVFNANHGSANGGEPLDVDLVSSVTGAPILASGRTLKAGETVPANDRMVGVSLEGEQIAWVVGVRVNDPDLLAAAKAGKITGSSWEAFVQRSDG
jgi:hypothetical protein